MLQDRRKRWWDQLLGNMYGGQSLPEDATREQQEDYLRKQAMGASGSALLGASGWSPVPITTGQALADAFGAGRQAYSQGSQDLIAQRKAMAEQQERDRQKAAMDRYRATLPPEQLALAEAMGVGPFAQAQAKQMFATPKDNRTSLAKNLVAAGYVEGSPEFQAALRQQLAKPTGTQVTFSMPGDQDRLGRIATQEEMAYLEERRGMPFPKGTVLQMSKDGWKPVPGSEQSTAEEKARVDIATKRGAMQSAEALLSQIETSNSNINSGPWMEPFGVKAGALVNKDVEKMDRTILQLHTQLRKLFRIPGEGTLTEGEQQALGLAMPKVGNRPETNQQIIANLRMILNNAARFSMDEPTEEGEPDDEALINKWLR